MSDGVVKWFDAKKGYGFIVSPEVEGDVFVHYTKIEMEGFKKLETGERIAFDVIRGEDGKPQAENVVRQGVAEAVAE
jgi:CspA family cold shock protein